MSRNRQPRREDATGAPVRRMEDGPLTRGPLTLVHGDAPEDAVARLDAVLDATEDPDVGRLEKHEGFLRQGLDTYRFAITPTETVFFTGPDYLIDPRVERQIIRALEIMRANSQHIADVAARCEQRHYEQRRQRQDDGA